MEDNGYFKLDESIVSVTIQDICPLCLEVTLQDIETDVEHLSGGKIVRSWGRRCRKCKQDWSGGKLPEMQYLKQ